MNLFRVENFELDVGDVDRHLETFNCELPAFLFAVLIVGYVGYRAPHLPCTAL